MKRGKLFLYIGLLLGLSLAVRGADDLKTYYEKQKAEILPTFVAPQLGSQVSIKISSGQTRTGILMKCTADLISLMSDSGSTMTYKRSSLHESSRAQFFAEDYAHVKALERTKLYKNEMHKDYVAEQAAGIHDGRIGVTASTEKDSDKHVEKKEQEIKSSGEKRIITTTTRTYTEVQNLKVNISNHATHTDTFTLKYYFFSSKVVATGNQNRKKENDADKTAGAPAVKSKGQRKVTVDARSRKTVELRSDAFQVAKTEIDYGHGSSRDPAEKGDENAGWLVLLMYDGEILDKKASMKTYLSDEWIRKYR